ncbi:MAG: phosphatase PAP2 family protein [Candidatus Moranbacteria bacterium]|nr:phosphatase PAP2 family protein [Candidatus Moranbacteria bacterium]
MKNIKNIFFGRNFLWHLLAIALTYIFVASGFDWAYFQATRPAALQTFFWPAVLAGAFIPLLGILLFYLISSAGKNAKLAGTALALGQAALLGLLVSDFYKFFTGRPGPSDVFGSIVAIDMTRIFHFGILRGGIFFGWPSSHTTIAFAMAVTLATLFPKNKLVKFIALVYAFYVGIGVSMTIHWFSDFAAGVIFGSVVGVVVGRSYRSRNSFSISRNKK